MTSRPSERTRRVPERLGVDAAERISAGCYGALVAASTLVGARDTTLGELTVIVVLTNVIYYATHVFAYTIGDRSPADTSVGKSIVHHLAVSAPIVSAAFAPLIVVVVLALLGVGQDAAIVGGVITAVLFLATVATTGAILRHVRALAVVLVAVVTIVISLLLVVAKLGLH